MAANTTYYYRVRAYNGNGTSPNSNVIDVMTAAAGQVAMPTFQPDGLDVEGCAYNYTFNVTISTSTSGAQIRWTIDGTTPSPTNGTLINGSSGVATFTISGVKTLQAMAYKTGMTNSSVKSAVYSFHRDCGHGAGFAMDDAGAPPAGPVGLDLLGTYTYTLDKAGNRTAVNGESYSPNAINQYISVGGSAITNGPDHEIQVDYGFTYHYMRDQELKQITYPGWSYDFAYDALGRCVKRTVDNTSITYYFHDGEKPILEYDENDALVGFNVYGKGIDEIVQRGAYGTDNQWHWYFMNQDHEGSVIWLTDSDGNMIEQYLYDAFGTPNFYNGNGTSISTTAYNNRFLFTGREYLGAWVYDYRARLYNAHYGRFMSEDPKLFDAGDYNLFRYVHNDPLDMTDPMGLDDRAPTYSPRETSQQKAEEFGPFHLDWTGLHMGAIGVGTQAYAAEQAFKISVGIEATKRAEAATGKSQVPYSVATMRYNDSRRVAFGDPVPGIRDTYGGYREVIDFHHERFADFRANPNLWNGGKGWNIFVIGHTHPLGRSQSPGFSSQDIRMQAGQLAGYRQAIPLFKNNPNWPGHVYDARMMGSGGWEVTHYSESGRLLSGPESD